RDQPDARYARALRDLFSPGAGSVDQNARGHFAGRGGESPALAGRLGTQQLGIGPDRPRAAAQRSKAGIVEGSDLDVGASALVPGANPLVTQAGDERIELFSIEPGWAIFAGQAANIADGLATGMNQMDCTAGAQQRRFAFRPARLE